MRNRSAVPSPVSRTFGALEREATVPTKAAAHPQQLARDGGDPTLPTSRLDRVLLAVTTGLAAATVLVLIDERVPLATMHPGLDLVFHTVATLSTAAVARLAYLRYGEAGRTASLFQAAGLLVLCAMNALNGLLILGDVDQGFGFSLLAPGQLPLYLWAVARLLSTALLVAGSIVVLRALRPSRRGVRLLLILPLAALALLSMGLLFAEARLPALVTPLTLGSLGAAAASRQPLPELSLGLAVLDGVAGLLLLTGAVLYRTRYRIGGSVSDGYLAIALVVAAFSQVHFILYPAVFTGLVSTGDVLRVAFYATLFLGMQAEGQSDLRALRSASASMERLRETELEAATMQERGRLARELHDGLAQDLWSAKLELLRLGESLALDGPAKAAFGRTAEALDQALVEARTAVTTLRGGFIPTSVTDELEPFLREVADRWGIDIAYVPAPQMRELQPRVQTEVLRIVQEAVTNSGRHADATVVRIAAVVDDDQLAVVVTDNGRGFEPESVVGRGFGLDGMRERASLIGGQLAISTAPGGGTRVELRVPYLAER